MKERFSPQRLQAARVRVGLSIDDLAYHSGVKRRTVFKVESGASRPHLATEMALAQALGVPLRTLYEEKRSE